MTFPPLRGRYSGSLLVKLPMCEHGRRHRRRAILS